MTRVNRTVRLAIKTAHTSDCRTKVGSVLLLGSRVLGKSANRYRHAPDFDWTTASLHAEELVLRSVKGERTRSTPRRRQDDQGR